MIEIIYDAEKNNKSLCLKKINNYSKMNSELEYTKAEK